MSLEPIVVRSRLGECAGETDGRVAFFDRADDKTGKSVRHFVLLDQDVKLMYEPWGWENEWYADIVRIERSGDGAICLTDIYIDIVIEGNGPTYRIVDLEDLAEAVTTGGVSRWELAQALRRAQTFLDDHLHRGKDFPPQCIRPYIVHVEKAREPHCLR
jgi:predicted RNA-binding protein associated with RNAse of E/G family